MNTPPIDIFAIAVERYREAQNKLEWNPYVNGIMPKTREFSQQRKRLSNESHRCYEDINRAEQVMHGIARGQAALMTEWGELRFTVNTTKKPKREILATVA
jgi:hypothetical protein